MRRIRLLLAALAVFVACPVFAAGTAPDAFVVLASQTINADAYTAVQVAKTYSSGILTVNVTALGTDQTLTVSFQYYNAATAGWVSILTTTAISATATQYISIDNPIITNAGTQFDWNLKIPRRWRLFLDIANTADCTLSIGFTPWATD